VHAESAGSRALCVRATHRALRHCARFATHTRDSASCPMLPRRVYFRDDEEETGGFAGSANWAGGQGVGANYLLQHRAPSSWCASVSRTRPPNSSWRPRAAIIIPTRAIPRFIDRSIAPNNTISMPINRACRENDFRRERARNRALSAFRRV